MRRCIFCGARAPHIKKEKGVYKMHCNCGMKIEDVYRENVVDMWNYEGAKEADVQGVSE